MFFTLCSLLCFRVFPLFSPYQETSPTPFGLGNRKNSVISAAVALTQPIQLSTLRKLIRMFAASLRLIPSYSFEFFP